MVKKTLLIGAGSVLAVAVVGIGYLAARGELGIWFNAFTWEWRQSGPTEADLALSKDLAEQARERHIAKFDVSNLVVDQEDLVHAADDEESIPAIMDPDHTPVDEVEHLRPDDRVIAVEIDGEAVAYPLLVMNWHELVNDVIAETPIAVSY